MSSDHSHSSNSSAGGRALNDPNEHTKFVGKSEEWQPSSRTALTNTTESAIWRKEEQEYQDSLAASSALVGEVLIDSPSSTHSPMHQRDNSNPTFRDTDVIDFRNRSATKLPPPPSSNQSSAPSMMNPPLTANNANALSVGMMAQGLAWVRRQRDTRKRQYLKNQAEKQLLKLRQATEDEQPTSHSLMDNPTFLNLTYYLRQSGNDGCSSTSVKEDEDNPRKISDFDASTSISKSGHGISVALSSFPLHDDEELDASFIPPVRVEDEHEDTDVNPFLLTPSQMQQIAVHVLPRGIAYCRWKRLYSLARDGDAFDAFLRVMHDHGRSLLVIRTSRNAVFGGYADSPWESHVQGGTCYYGGSSACLFKIDPLTDKVKYYKWTGANHYVQLCDVSSKMIAFGGGGEAGSFGLCLEEDFQVGSTGHCATFDNEPLCDQENFAVVDMEAYGFLVGQF